MPIAVTCTCGERFSAPDHFAGKSGRCTKCGADLPVPAVPSAGTANEQLAALGRAGGARVLGGYTLQKKLGDATSNVWLATAADGKKVALKILLENKGAVTAEKRFLREARALSGLDHENVVKSLDAGEELGCLYLAMELFEARNVRELIAQAGGRLPENRAIQIATGAARALGFLASKGLVHRNVKPEHVLVSSTLQVKLVGLGLVKEAGGESSPGAPLTVRGAVVGSPHYMSPEQAEGSTDLDLRSDLFSLGSTIYEMLAGRPPWNEPSTIAVLKGLTQDPPPPLQKVAPHTSAAIGKVVEKLLEKEPSDRYRDAETLVSDLIAIEQGNLPNGEPPSFSAPKQSSSARVPAAAAPAPAAAPASDGTVKKLIAAVAVLAILVVGLVVALLAS